MILRYPGVVQRTKNSALDAFGRGQEAKHGQASCPARPESLTKAGPPAFFHSATHLGKMSPRHCFPPGSIRFSIQGVHQLKLSRSFLFSTGPPALGGPVRYWAMKVVTLVLSLLFVDGKRVYFPLSGIDSVCAACKMFHVASLLVVAHELPF